MRLEWLRKSSPNLGKTLFFVKVLVLISQNRAVGPSVLLQDDINWLSAHLEIRQNGWGPVLVSLHSYCHIALRSVLRYPLYARGGEDVRNTLAVRAPVADITSGFVTYFLVLSLHFICLCHLSYCRLNNSDDLILFPFRIRACTARHFVGMLYSGADNGVISLE